MAAGSCQKCLQLRLWVEVDTGNDRVYWTQHWKDMVVRLISRWWGSSGTNAE